MNHKRHLSVDFVSLDLVVHLVVISSKQTPYWELWGAMMQ